MPDSPPQLAKTGWPRALAAAAAILIAFLALTPWTTLWDRDEPRFAEAAVEMLASGNYLYPTFNGHLRPDKPILIYWLMALSARLLGATELGLRFWAPVGLALTALLTWWTGRRLLSPRAGLWAMAVLATTPLTLMEGLAATTDAVLLAAITGALAAFAAALSRGPRGLHLVALTAALGLAQLAKGPVGLAVPVLAMLGALGWLAWRERAGRGTGGYVLLIVLAAVLGTGIFLLWAVPANEATFGEFARLGVGHQVVDRSLSPMEGHGGNRLLSLPYYLIVALAGFAPWTLYLPGAASAVLGGRVGGPRPRALLVGWVAPVFVMFTLIATKLPHYLLPVWPALALAVGGTLAAGQEGRLAERDLLWLRRGAWLFAPVALLAAAGLLAVAWKPPLAGLRWPCLALALVILGTAFAALRRHLGGDLARGARLLCGGTALALAIAGAWALPAFDRLKPVPPVAAAIRAGTPPDTPLATFDFDEPSLVFYARRTPVAPLPSEAAVAAWAHAGDYGVLVLPRAALDRITAAYGPLPLREIAAARGVNISKGRRLELVALARNLPENERGRPQLR
ncbi:MAG TPA: glycosyltransferase family 39 protein [Thermoanaerobaculia bacterium]|nr:glycosyltransferase family 39 protein [Thermoanaerobaculia bacterium]